MISNRMYHKNINFINKRKFKYNKQNISILYSYRKLFKIFLNYTFTRINNSIHVDMLFMNETHLLIHINIFAMNVATPHDSIDGGLFNVVGHVPTTSETNDPWK